MQSTLLCSPCRVDNDRVVTNRPLAGTRRRGSDPAADLALEKELLADQKECAEHVMLVDLGRNDVGKVRPCAIVYIRTI
jgi:anthranilate synthase component 1